MFRCKRYLSEFEEYCWHDPQNSDLIHVRFVCILCGEFATGSYWDGKRVGLKTMDHGGITQKTKESFPGRGE